MVCGSNGFVSYTKNNVGQITRSIKGHQHDCGRPGINGGYIGNENVKFGINCYGYKPKMTPLEKELLDNSTPMPMTRREKRFEKKVNEYRKKLPRHA